MFKLSTEEAIKCLNGACENIIPEKTYTAITDYPEKGDHHSCTGAQLIRARDAYLILHEAEKIGDKKRIAETITKINKLQQEMISLKDEELNDPYFFMRRFLSEVDVKEDDIFTFTHNGKVVSDFTGAMILQDSHKKINLFDKAQADLKKKALDITLRSLKN